MFSQPTIKRFNMTQSYMPMQQLQSNMSLYNQNNIDFNNNSYQNMNIPMNDNMSYYSSASTATNLTNNLKKKNLMDEFNSILNNCMENLLPKIAEECADFVFTKISSELDKQSKEIEELKSQLAQFEAIIKDKLNHRIFDSDSTPYRNLRQFNGDISEINSLIADQSVLLKELKSNGNRQEENNYLPIFDCLNKKIYSLKGHIEEERKMAEKLNYGIKDRHVDLLGVKNLIDDKINYLINDMKIKSTNEARLNENSEDNHLIEKDNKMFELIDIVDVLYEKINNGNHTQSNKKEFCNLEISHNRERLNYDNNLKINSNNNFHVNSVNSKINQIKDNFTQGNFNFPNNNSVNLISTTNPIIMSDTKPLIKGKNMTMNSISVNAKKNNKRINLANKFTF